MINILLVEDDMLLRLVVMTSIGLTFKDCKVLTAGSGKEAVNILGSEHVDFVLTDLCMQEMDGFQLIEYINTNHPEIPVAAMSGDGGTTIRERVHALGVSKFLEKPFNLKELHTTISELPGIGKNATAISFTTA
ncbi:MAG: response regulator [Nitrospiraceae bacterium]|nr:response regulator [Nitrospiraceae bacterium]